MFKERSRGLQGEGISAVIGGNRTHVRHPIIEQTGEVWCIESSANFIVGKAILVQA